MRFSLLAGLLFLAVNLASDYYIFRRLSGRRLRAVHLAASALLSLLWLCVVCMPKRVGDDAFLLKLMWTIYAYATVYLSKYVGVLTDAIGGIPRLWGGRRWRAFTYVGVMLGFATFITLWTGALIERLRLESGACRRDRGQSAALHSRDCV